MPKKKESDKVHIPGITRQDGELAIDFVDFLVYYEDHPNFNIYIEAGIYCQMRKFPTQKVDRFYNLLHMYVHKILRHRNFLKGET